MKRNKSGISLIVLVITIIVMIILAGSVIISLSNSGIIGRANEAVNANNLKQVQSLAALAWSEAYIDKLTDKSVDIEERVMEALEENKVDMTKYDIEVTDGGVSVYKKGTHWKLVKTVADGKVTSVKVTNGIDTLDVGTTINYMPEGVGPTNAKYTGGWKILGVDKAGNLLIMSTSAVVDYLPLGSYDSLEEATESYENALTTLQTAVNDYKDGKIGVKVRSVEVEDIDALTAFEKTTYGSGQMYQYGNKVTYSWNGTDNKPAYSYGTVTGKQLSVAHASGFTYYNEKTGKVTTSPYVAGQSGKITELESNYYYYYMPDYIDESIPAYSLINDDGNYYWLASRSINTISGYANFGVRLVYDGNVNGKYLFDSNGGYIAGEYAVRAVVTLASDIQLTESKTATGTYDVTLAK